MRKIKFRIWNSLDKCFVFMDMNDPLCRSCAYSEDGNTIYFLTTSANLNGKPAKIKNLCVENCSRFQQYTGLKDCNGREIFEGDILFHMSEQQSVKVKFTNGAFCFFGVGAKHPEDGYVLTSEYGAEMIVVGNIFENPDLL